MLFSSDIIIKPNKTFLLFLHSKHDKHAMINFVWVKEKLSAKHIWLQVQNSHQPETWIIYKRRIIIICQKAQQTAVTEASALSLRTILKVIQGGIRFCGKVLSPASKILPMLNNIIVTRCSCEYQLCSYLTRIAITLNCCSVLGQIQCTKPPEYLLLHKQAITVGSSSGFSIKFLHDWRKFDLPKLYASKTHILALSWWLFLINTCY